MTYAFARRYWWKIKSVPRSGSAVHNIERGFSIYCLYNDDNKIHKLWKSFINDKLGRKRQIFLCVISFLGDVLLSQLGKNANAAD